MSLDPPSPAAAAADRLSGVYAAVLTPLDADLAPDHGLLALHCRFLLSRGCAGLSILGTTGEANSFAVDERVAILERLLAAGVPGGMLLPGVGCCALPDTVRLTAHAVGLGVANVLMLPPFYYKAVTDDGLFAYYAEVIERVGRPDLRVHLYHFPQLSGVPLGLRLIERLVTRYPDVVVGLKDSSGDLAGMTATARAIPDFAVFSGSDELLLPLLSAGGAGCITAVSNVASSIAAEVFAAHRRGDLAAAETAQARLSQIRRTILAYPLSAALKATLARATDWASWRRLRPPLVAMSDADDAALAAALAAIDFAVSPVAGLSR